jgi:iron complex outermembrane receptor protein
MRRIILGSGLYAALFVPAVQAQELEELTILERSDARTIDVTEALSVAPDPARLLFAAPGANVNSNGPITGIPQYRGLFGPRISVSLNGNLLAPAGPNWMDPPLSYAVSAQLESLELYRGIAPVHVAQESLGGAIDARTRRIAYAASGEVNLEGQLLGSAQSVNGGQQFDADVQLATEAQRFKLSAMTQSGDDARFPGGEILPSRYTRQRYDIGVSRRFGAHELQLDYGHNRTGEAGTPALAMDIDYFTGDLLAMTYRYQPRDSLEVELSLYGSDLEHGMTNFHLRPVSGPAAQRQNIASSRNRGFRLQATRTDSAGSWRLGADGFGERHQSDIDNPANPMFFVVAFNRAEREVLGLFLSREQEFSETLRGELGLRVNHVRADAGEVDGTPAMMMPPAQLLRDRFNDADRSQSDVNMDVVFKVHHATTERLSLYAGVSRKQRAASFQERYLWLPLEATAGLADGQLYFGNITLDPETAYAFEAGVDFTGNGFSLHPRVFYTRIDDFIQGTPLAASEPAAAMVRMMNMSTGAARPGPLQFNNVDAALYGLDLDWRWQLSDHFALSGLVNYVRGERRDIDDALYRIAPPNATLRLAYARADWQVSLETVAYAAQDRISASNREQRSPGYGVLNIQGSWAPREHLQLSVGIDNILDREYTPHLGGYNRVANPDVAVGTRLPAQGVNLFGRLLYRF